MKKLNITKTGLIIGLLIIIFGFVSCSNDDDIISTETETTTNINNETLKGTWYSNVVKNEEGTDIRWVINIDNERMDKYIQYKNGNAWGNLKDNLFTCYSIQYSNQIITGKVIEKVGGMSIFISLGLSKYKRELLKQRKQEHDVIKITDFVGKNLKMELLEKEEAQTLTFEKGEQIEMLEIKTSWK